MMQHGTNSLMRATCCLTASCLSFLAPSLADQAPQSPAISPVNANDESPSATFDLPTWGTQWVIEPEYKVNGRPVWKLNSYSADFLLKNSPNPAFGGILRSERTGGLRYDATRQGFIAPDTLSPEPVKDAQSEVPSSAVVPMPLLAWSEAGRNIFGAAGNACPVVSFFAPYSGKYMFEVRAKSVRFLAPFRSLSLNITTHRASQFQNASARYIQRTTEQNAEVGEKATVDMKAGEEVGFVANADSTQREGAAYFEDFSVRATYFSVPK